MGELMYNKIMIKPIFGIAGSLNLKDDYPDFYGKFVAKIDVGGENLLVAMMDNHLKNDNKLNIDMHTVNVNRVLDIEDRSLRKIITGLSRRQI
jgi:formate--tetrahydrofolate ligase